MSVVSSFQPKKMKINGHMPDFKVTDFQEIWKRRMLQSKVGNVEQGSVLQRKLQVYNCHK